MVKKCLTIDALPFLVARKFPFVTHAVFSRLGIMGFQIHNQYFSPLVEGSLAEIRHKDSLGYKDVITSDPNHSHPHLVRFLQALPTKLSSWRAKWDESRELLHEFAVTNRLGDPALPNPQRQQTYRELSQILFPREIEIEDQGPAEDYW